MKDHIVIQAIVWLLEDRIRHGDAPTERKARHLLDALNREMDADARELPDEHDLHKREGEGGAPYTAE